MEVNVHVDKVVYNKNNFYIFTAVQELSVLNFLAVEVDEFRISVMGFSNIALKTGDKVVAIDPEIELDAKYGYTLKAKTLLPAPEDIFDENGELVANPRYNNIRNLSVFLAPVCAVRGLGEKKIAGILEVLHKGLGSQEEHESISKMIKIILEKPTELIEMYRALKPRATQKFIKKVEELLKEWQLNMNIQKQYLVLAEYGLTNNEIFKLLEVYRGNAVNILKDNPYQATTIAGIGWSKADLIGLKLGIAEDDPRRIKFGFMSYYNETCAREGGTLLPSRESFRILNDEKFKFSKSEYSVKLGEFMLRSFIGHEFILFPFHTKNGILNYFTSKYDYISENNIKEKLLDYKHYGLFFDMLKVDELLRNVVDISEYLPNGDSYTLDESQRNAIIMALENPISVITGGAGTGKTTILKKLLKCAIHFNLRVAVMAPTGKASKRINESIGELACAMTIHSTFEYNPIVKMAGINEDNPLEVDWIFIDESSMVDLEVANVILNGVKKGTRITFLGDSNQLPSVGRGCFFFDIIDGGKIPVARLNTLHRQKDGNDIIPVAHAILEGGKLNLNYRKNVIYEAYDEGEDVDQKLINNQIRDDLVQKYMDLCKESSPTEIQILTPARKENSSILSADALNKLIRDKLFDSPKDPFVVGDRVIGIKNNDEFLNGELGTVVVSEDNGKNIEVLFDGGSTPTEISKKNVQYLDYGYAITVHKSQGSEYKYILVPMSKSSSFMLNKNWFYTAVTRAKDKVFIYGQDKAIKIATWRQSTRRNTLLRYLFNDIKPIIYENEKPVDNNKKHFKL